MGNFISQRYLTKEPVVGEGATELHATDRWPYTVIAISKSGNQAIIQHDTTIYASSPGGPYGLQQYTYERNPQGTTRLVRRTKDGRWRVVYQDYIFTDRGMEHPEVPVEEVDTRKGKSEGCYVHFGYRSEYREPSN